MADYKLLDIVNEWLIENGKSENVRDRIYTIALSGLRELHLDVNGIIKIVELCVNDNDTVDLPNDFINYRKIGIVGADGQIHSMGVDNSISLQPSCGVDGRDVDENANPVPFNSLPFAGTFWGVTYGNGGLFGIGGGNNAIGYYRLNKKTNQLWLSGLTAFGPYGAGRVTTVVVEYISDLDVGSSGEDFIVHPYAIQVVKDWISWRSVNGDRNTGTGEKEQRRREYFNSLRICKNRYGAITPSEWAQTLRESNSATVRW